MQKNNIILIGFMGSGKSAFGRWSSNNIHMNFCDTDEYIEQKMKKTINDIFAEYGEEYFRNLETETIKELCGSLKNTVVSVGGGLPVKEENRQLLRELGTVVYLRASEDTLVKRLSGDNKRPLLAGVDVRTKIRQLMKVRASIYEDAADVIVDTDDKRFEQINEDLKNKMSD